MRATIMAAVAAGAMMAATTTTGALAQDSNQGGWRGTVDQLNRTINPDSYPDKTGIDANESRRNEGSTTGRSGGNSQYSRWSDRDLRDEHSRVEREARDLGRERRAIEDEMDRRGLK